MANFSMSNSIGLVDNAEDSWTTGTNAPSAGDVEIRVNLANLPDRKAVVLLLKSAIRRWNGERFGSSDLAVR